MAFQDVAASLSRRWIIIIIIIVVVVVTVDLLLQVLGGGGVYSIVAEVCILLAYDTVSSGY